MQAAEVVDCVGCRMENMMEIPTHYFKEIEASEMIC